MPRSDPAEGAAPTEMVLPEVPAAYEGAANSVLRPRTKIAEEAPSAKNFRAIPWRTLGDLPGEIFSTDGPAFITTHRRFVGAMGSRV